MNPTLRTTTLATALAFALIPSAAAAADAQKSPALKTLDTISVTAHRSEVAIDRTLAATTIISRDDIVASQSPDLIDLLARQAGIDISRNGGPGQASTVFLRGSNSNHTLVLIDGLRVNSASQGVFDFAHLPLGRIERIEIVRGPRAALWGADAIGGVIHIFTRDPSQTTAELRAGSDSRFGADATFGAGTDENGFGIGIGAEHLDGFSATNPRAFGHDPDHDGYRNRNLNLAARTRLGSQRLAFTGVATDADVQFDQGETAARNASFGSVLTGELGAGWAHSLALGHSRETLQTEAFDDHVRSRRSSLDWLFNHRIGTLGLLKLGINAEHESTLSTSAFSGTVIDRSRNNHAGFIAWHGEGQRFDHELALRHDDNSQFGTATTAQAALAWQASATLRLRANWGEGFRAPNFNELYHPGFGGFFAGNPALAPERSRSRELGLAWTPMAGQQLELSAYRTRVDQLITFTGPNAQAENIAHANLKGIEASYRGQFGPLVLQANASWQRARNADTGTDLLRRARRKGNISVDYTFERGWSLGLDGQGVAARDDFSGTLPGFARFDARLNLPVNQRWSLEARVENLGDRFYQWADGFNTPDRSLLLRLRYAGE